MENSLLKGFIYMALVSTSIAQTFDAVTVDKVTRTQRMDKVLFNNSSNEYKGAKLTLTNNISVTGISTNPSLSSSSTSNLMTELAIKTAIMSGTGGVYSSIYPIALYGSNGVDDIKSSGDPMGFPDTQVNRWSQNFVDSSRTFSNILLSATADYFWKGSKYTYSTSPSIQITTNLGIHYIFIDNATGTLKETNTVWNFSNNVQVATVYWTGQTGFLGYELHRTSMPWTSHELEHVTKGSDYGSGFGSLSVAVNSFSIGSGTWYDEDIKYEVPATNKCRVVYHTNVNFMVWTAERDVPYLTNSTGNEILWDNLTTTQLVASGEYVAYWLVTANSTSTPLVTIMGQRVDTTLNNAIANNTFNSLNLSTYPSAELKPLYRFIYHRAPGTGVLNFDQYDDYRRENLVTLAASTTETDPIALPIAQYASNNIPNWSYFPAISNVNGASLSSTNWANFQITNTLTVGKSTNDTKVYPACAIQIPDYRYGFTNGIAWGNDLVLYRSASRALSLGGNNGTNNASFTLYTLVAGNYAQAPVYYGGANADWICRMTTTNVRKFVWQDHLSNYFMTLTNAAGTITLSSGISPLASTNAFKVTAGTNLFILGDTGPVFINGSSVTISNLVTSGGGATANDTNYFRNVANATNFLNMSPDFDVNFAGKAATNLSRISIGASATNTTAPIEIDSSVSAATLVQFCRTSANAALRLLNYNGTTGRNSFQWQTTLNTMTNWVDIMHFDANRARVGIYTNSAAATLDINGSLITRGNYDVQGNSITNALNIVATNKLSIGNAYQLPSASAGIASTNLNEFLQFTLSSDNRYRNSFYSSAGDLGSSWIELGLATNANLQYLGARFYSSGLTDFKGGIVSNATFYGDGTGLSGVSASATNVNYDGVSTPNYSTYFLGYPKITLTTNMVSVSSSGGTTIILNSFTNVFDNNFTSISTTGTASSQRHNYSIDLRSNYTGFVMLKVYTKPTSGSMGVAVGSRGVTNVVVSGVVSGGTFSEGIDSMVTKNATTTAYPGTALRPFCGRFININLDGTGSGWAGTYWISELSVWGVTNGFNNYTGNPIE